MVKIGLKANTLFLENAYIFKLDQTHASFLSGNMQLTLYLSIVDDTYYKCPQY